MYLCVAAHGRHAGSNYLGCSGVAWPSTAKYARSRLAMNLPMSKAMGP